MSLALANLPTESFVFEAKWGLGLARAPLVRPMTDWVEAEIILPSGPYSGERYRHYRHPVSRLWFSEVDSGRWTRFAATGPTQNGKSLMCYVAPSLYQLFEIGETVIIGLPHMDMASDKWQQDFKPVIEASRYRDLLPLKGEGSRGGQVKRAITFRNGASLRFMSGGGNDKKRAGYTARVVAITETDGMDEAGEASREADKVEQIEARTRAFGRTGKRVFLECTVSVEAGRIWQEIKHGSDSKIVRPCPHCKEFVAPEREHLIGWEDADSEEAAARMAFWSCPACGEAWSEDDRRKAAQSALLLHRGQSIDTAGIVTGEIPQTQTLGFRWSAIDNPFVTAADLGAEEWKTKRAENRENAEKKARQFIWSLPYEPPDIDLTPLEASAVAARFEKNARRELPAGCHDIIVGIDTGKRELHWVAIAVSPDGSKLYVIEYGTQEVQADRLGVFRGLLEAFRTLRAYLEKGWQGPEGRFKPSQVWIDSAYHEHTDAVYALCAEANKGLPVGSEVYRPTKGYGEGQKRMTPYRAPSSRDANVLFVGTQFHIARVKRNGRILPGVLLVHVNADHWKSEVHQRLSMPTDSAGAMVLYDAADNANEHADFGMHITAEKQVLKFIPGKGEVTVFERISRANHKLDATYLSTAGAAFVLGFRNQQQLRRLPKERPTAAQLAGRT